VAASVVAAEADGASNRPDRKSSITNPANQLIKHCS
jgi:hypothetical protein